MFDILVVFSIYKLKLYYIKLTTLQYTTSRSFNFITDILLVILEIILK